MPGISYDGPYEDNKNLTMLLEDVLTMLGITPGSDAFVTNEMLLEAIANGVSGSGSGGSTCDCRLVVTQTYAEATGTYTLNKTWQEIYDALAAGKTVNVVDASTNDVSCVNATRAYLNSGTYTVTVGSNEYTASAASGNPSRTVTQ